MIHAVISHWNYIYMFNKDKEGEHNLKDGKIACEQHFSLGVFFFLTAGFEGKGDDILTRAGGLHPCKNVNPRRA